MYIEFQDERYICPKLFMYAFSIKLLVGESWKVSLSSDTELSQSMGKLGHILGAPNIA